MELADFLLDRIAEDESAAQAASDGGWSYPGIESVSGGLLYDNTRQIAQISWDNPGDHDGTIARVLPKREADANGAHIVRHDPTRVLAECEAKRHVVRRFRREKGRFDEFGDTVDNSAQSVAAWTHAVAYLAAVYADHPDYQSEWAL